MKKVLKNNNGRSRFGTIIIIVIVIVVLGSIIDAINPSEEEADKAVILTTTNVVAPDEPLNSTKANSTIKTTTTMSTTKHQTVRQTEMRQETYVVNTNTGKFHYPNCSSVGQMAEHNKNVVTASRNELISQGYSPCGRCHP